ncbi:MULTISPECIES: copper resistance CopC/CopD family protein [Streptomyces]|uniref:copper resistance CopC/CopD family protein n=1 Tax=Streptomyces TaxID=1883 RepID=UPI000241B85E|nr:MULTISPECIES: copper resistance protein CopC [Streptomyces]EHM26873.1 putative integral membrane protein [Streptomyces sp. W007]WSU74784.1 copper resistance protein CopC [Streptomyces anulatus]WTD11119.1 copper resistance protein CopC [Streptomyces anulatus]WTD26854.1 copper resistance protein CopC [Streptomyces anulatus]WTE04428.1 copper resistance protein CopC [Streptomyces anulatus]
MSATAPYAGPSPIRRPVAAAALLAALVSLVFGLLLAGAGPASAHAALTGSDPQDGAVVDTAPKEVTLSFSEAIAVGDDSIRVLDPSGKRADTEAEPRDLSEGSTVRYGVALHSGLPDGTYTVAWQAISADSHPISGAFTFSIGAPSETTVALSSQEAGGGPVGVVYDIARYAAYGGFVLLVGGSAFVLICWRGGASALPMQRLVVRGWLTLTAATLVMLLLRNPYTGSGKFSDAFDLAGLQSVLDTKPGAALVSRLLLLGAAALFIAVLFGTYARREDEREKKDLTFGLAVGGGVVAAGIAATWAMSEHASTGIQASIAMPVDVAHLLAVAAWLGGLASLLVALYRTPDIGSAAVRRFSAVAFSSVVVLAATGIYQSWRQVGSWSALTGTRYGQLLIIKVALIAVLLAVAWFSRRWTGRLTDTAVASSGGKEEAAEENTAPAAPDEESEDVAPERAAQLARQRAVLTATKKKRIRDADPERSGLRRSVLAEAAVAVVLLAVTTMLTSTEPGRTEEEAAGGATAATAPAADGPVNLSMPFDTGGRNGKGTVRIDIDPGRTGSNDLHVWIDGSDGEPMDVPELKLALTLESKDIGPLPVVPDRLAEGHWTASGVQIPMAGDWKVDVTVRTSDIDQVTIDKNAKIG